MPKLVVKEPGRTRVVSLKGKSITLGRASTNTLALRDTSLSRSHCEIRVNGEACTVLDLRSRNGTMVNGVVLKEEEERALEIGDKVEIGNCLLVFERELPDRDYTLRPKEKDTDKPLEAPDAPSDDLATMFVEKKKKETRRVAQEAAAAAEPPAGAAAAPDVSVWTHTASPVLGLIVVAVVLAAAGGGWAAFAARRDPGKTEGETKNALGAAGSFDGPDSPWKLPEGAHGSITRLPEGGKSGGCLELELVAGTPVVEAIGPVAPVVAGKCYRLSFAARSHAPEAVAGARLQWLVGEEAQDAADRSVLASLATDWSRVERVFRAPEGCGGARLALLAIGDAGKVQFDDLVLEETRSGPEKARDESAGPLTLTWGGDGRFALAAGKAVLVAGCGTEWIGGEVVVDQTLARDVRAGPGDHGAAWKMVHPVTARWEPFSAELRLEEGNAQVLLHLPARTSRGLDAVIVDFHVPGTPAEFTVHGSAGAKRCPDRFEEAGVEVLQVKRGEDSFAFTCGQPVSLRVEPIAGGSRVRMGFPGKKVDELQNFVIGVAWGEAVGQAVRRGPSLASAEAHEKRGECGRALAGYRAVVESGGKVGPETQIAADKVRNLEARATAELEDTRRKMDEAADLDSDELCRGVERSLSRLAAEWDGSDFAAQAAELLAESGKLRTEVADRRRAAVAGRLLTQGKGFAAEGKPMIARAFFRTVVDRFPGTESAKEAQTELQKQ